VLTAQLNDGTPVELGFRNAAQDSLERPFDRLRLRTGTGPTWFFVDNLTVTIDGTSMVWNEEPDIATAQMFTDGFENSGLGGAPGGGDPDLGGYDLSGAFFSVLDGPDPLNDISPAAPHSGSQHLGIDDSEGGRNDPQLSLLLETSPPGAFLAELHGMTFEFWIWMAAAEDSLATFQVSRGIPMDADNQLLVVSIGGPDLKLQSWNGAEWVDSGLTIPDQEWAKVTAEWDGAMFVASVNDSEPVELSLFGPPTLKLTRAIFGQVEGTTNTAYFLDDISAEIFCLGEGLGEVMMSAALVGDNLEISWDPARGVLQTATDVAGPWTDVAEAVSPYVTAVTEAVQAFFRVAQP